MKTQRRGRRGRRRPPTFSWGESSSRLFEKEAQGKSPIFLAAILNMETPIISLSSFVCCLFPSFYGSCVFPFLSKSFYGTLVCKVCRVFCTVSVFPFLPCFILVCLSLPSLYHLLLYLLLHRMEQHLKFTVASFPDTTPFIFER